MKAVTDVSVTVDRDGVEHKVSIDRVTHAPEPLHPTTLKPSEPTTANEAERKEG